MVMAAPQQTMLPQQAMQNLQNPPTIAPMPSQGGSTTITTMSTGPPQQMTDWPGHGRVSRRSFDCFFFFNFQRSLFKKIF